METMTQKTDLKNLDKSNWESFRFDQIADKISETVDPNTTDLEIYVGLEHIDAEDIHIKRFGTPADVSGGKLKCYPEDVIFGKRRAYQRKAAVVDFEGICSAHAFVLRAKPKVIDAKLFPFFLHSDAFMHRMVDISVGGLSPTINWGDLKHQEFLLPPKDQQAQLAELLWAMDEVIERERKLMTQLEICFSSYRKNFIENGVRLKQSRKRVRFGYVNDEWPIKRLGEVCKLIGGNAFKSKDFQEAGKFQVLRMGNLTDKGLDLSKSPVFLNVIGDAERKYLIPKSALILSLTGTNGKRDYGFPILMDEDRKYLLNQRLVMIQPIEDTLLPEFLYLITKTEIFKGQFFLNAIGSANQANVSTVDVADIEIPLPKLDEQREIVSKMSFVRAGITDNQQTITASKDLQKSLINQVF